ncbi:MAG: tetratricopeptide repeat protein, partial [Planctomycetes bacterium]|nr:tetratricopeptide repeat protein [Planctomycetota bacterium]
MVPPARLVLLALLLAACGAEPSGEARTPDAAAGPTAGVALASHASAGSQVCAECHQDLHRDFTATVSMAKAFHPIGAEPDVEDWTGANTLRHAASGFTYRMEKRGGRYFQRRWIDGPDGAPMHVHEQEITHVIGSGRNVRTYVHYQPGGVATQLPVSWYSDGGGKWAMSPGYDRPDHADFARPIDHGCMFCHNGYPNVAADDHTGAAYVGELPRGIDCQRCHGDGERHMQLARDPDSSYDDVIDAIVNAGAMDAKRSMDSCLQCHLETAVNPGLPHSLRRFDRDIFSFRAGEDLEDYLLPFDSPPGTDTDDRFEIAHHGYRLMQSKCFQQSAGELTCLTCHDPHHTPTPTDAQAHFRAACATCHDEGACGQQHGDAAAIGASPGDCITCHMPRRRTIDVVHAVMRDHRIVRRPPARDLTAPLTEQHEVYQGDLTFFLPETAPTGAEGDLYLGTAYLQGGVHVQRGIELVERALQNGAPPAAPPLRMLGLAKGQQGDLEGAVAAFERGLALAPDDVALRAQLGATLRALGRNDEATAHLEQVLERAPDHVDALVALADLAAAGGDRATARRQLEHALRTDPGHARAVRSFVGLCFATRDFESARAALRER